MARAPHGRAARGGRLCVDTRGPAAPLARSPCLGVVFRADRQPPADRGPAARRALRGGRQPLELPRWNRSHGRLAPEVRLSNQARDGEDPDRRVRSARVGVAVRRPSERGAQASDRAPPRRRRSHGRSIRRVPRRHVRSRARPQTLSTRRVRRCTPRQDADRARCDSGRKAQAPGLFMVAGTRSDYRFRRHAH